MVKFFTNVLTVKSNLGKRPSLASFVTVSSTGVKSVTPLDIMKSEEGLRTWTETKRVVQDKEKEGKRPNIKVTLIEKDEVAR